MTFLSIVIPVYNEEESISILCQEVWAMAKSQGYEAEIVIVDDGSTDETFLESKKIKNAKVIRLRKNCGQSTAIEIGIRNSSGEFIALLDGDGQNDPLGIPQMLEYLLKNDFDMVVGWRFNRKDKFLKRLSSRIAWGIRHVLLSESIHDSGCTLKVMKRSTANQLKVKGQLHRLLPALASIQGFSVGELKVNHRPRIYGKTKYRWTRGVNGIADILLISYRKRYSQRPIHFFGGLTAMFSLVGLLLLIAQIWNLNFYGDPFKVLIFIALSSIIFGIGIILDSIESVSEWDPEKFIIEVSHEANKKNEISETL